MIAVRRRCDLAEAARRGDAIAAAENSGCITAPFARDHLVRSDLINWLIAHLITHAAGHDCGAKIFAARGLCRLVEARAKGIARPAPPVCAKFGNIFRWDGDALRLVATHGVWVCQRTLLRSRCSLGITGPPRPKKPMPPATAAEASKARRSRTVRRKRPNAPNNVARRVSSAAGADGEVVRLTRELNDTLEQQTATGGAANHQQFLRRS
jgi:hypothetical protein